MKTLAILSQVKQSHKDTFENLDIYALTKVIKENTDGTRSTT